MEQLPERLTVDELTLRPPAESDRSDYLRVLNLSDEIARWTTIPFPYGDDDFSEFLEVFRDGYVIERDRAVVGGIDGPTDTETATATFGYWLAPEARGHGIVTRAGRAICANLFAVGVQRIVAEVLVGNLASGAVLDRLGFTLEGVARSMHPGRCGLDGNRIDEQIWSLLPGELLPAELVPA